MACAVYGCAEPAVWLHSTMQARQHSCRASRCTDAFMYHVYNPVVACRWSCYLVAAMVVHTGICWLPDSFLVQEYIMQGTVDLLAQVLLVGKHQCCVKKRTLGLVCIARVMLAVLQLPMHF